MLDVDRELVPRPTRIPVPPTERKRQILLQETAQIRILASRGFTQKLVSFDVPVEAGEERGVDVEGLTIEVPDELPQISRGDRISGLEDAPAHHVEQDVGEVVRRTESIAGLLESVGTGHDRTQTPGAFFHIVQNKLFDIVI